MTQQATPVSFKPMSPTQRILAEKVIKARYGALRTAIGLSEFVIPDTLRQIPNISILGYLQYDKYSSGGNGYGNLDKAKCEKVLHWSGREWFQAALVEHDEDAAAREWAKLPQAVRDVFTNKAAIAKARIKNGEKIDRLTKARDDLEEKSNDEWTKATNNLDKPVNLENERRTKVVQKMQQQKRKMLTALLVQEQEHVVNLSFGAAGIDVQSFLKTLPEPGVVMQQAAQLGLDVSMVEVSPLLLPVDVPHTHG